jgi:Uncharacterized conserved protein (DUF2190)
MSQQNDTGFKGFLASAAIAQYARVKMASDGTISTAGLTDKEIGIAQNQAFAAGDQVNVKLRNAPGTHKMIAGAAITRGAPVAGIASGKIDDALTATGFLSGTALEAATADGDIIEVLYNQHGDTALT